MFGGSSVAVAGKDFPGATSTQVTAPRGDFGPLGPLTDLAVERLLLADKVAAAKFGTDKPIDDPAREQQVLDKVAELSISVGVDAEVSKRFFRDQMEANKLVQRSLYELWTTHPELRPTDRPDLALEIRPQLDTITTGMLEQLKITSDVRRPGVECEVGLFSTIFSAAVDKQLDELHISALGAALGSVCTAS
ncbi:MAG: gamma subclass chorismate mutase AroQ [Longispora sp.]|nr:gamma subclass chorismate mutase AroQ [Longispora sp. (in: high G+C Gram-positive bacteria)]